MPFNIGQLFVKNPYDNPVDEETGLQKRPSIWQSMAWTPEADRVYLNNYQQKQYTATDKPLGANPNYDPSGIDPWGSDNPYVRPSATTSFWHPETLKTFEQFQNAPLETQLEANRLKTLAPIETENAVERTKKLLKAHEDHIDNTISSGLIALRHVGGLKDMPPEYQNADNETLVNLVKNSKEYQDLYNQQMVRFNLENHLPKVQAEKSKAEAEQGMHEANLADLEAVEKLNMSPEVKKLVRGSLHNRLFSTYHGGETPLSVMQNRTIATQLGDGSYAYDPTPKGIYQNRKIDALKDEMEYAKSLTGGGGIVKNPEALNGTDISKVAPVSPTLSATERPVVGLSGTNKPVTRFNPNEIFAPIPGEAEPAETFSGPTNKSDLLRKIGFTLVNGKLQALPKLVPSTSGAENIGGQSYVEVPRSPEEIQRMKRQAYILLNK